VIHLHPGKKARPNQNGIAGTGVDMFEAIGQGNDQLMDIEHVIGPSQDDVIIGNGLDNTLEGNDTYILDNFGDIVDEGFTGSGGTDWVRSSVSVNLTNMANFQGNIENIVLLSNAGGAGALGNSRANSIFGNASGNILSGREGNDILTGDAGQTRNALMLRPPCAITMSYNLKSLSSAVKVALRSKNTP
jgi:Ca2+-binding RTX toxin-like protein